MPNTAYQESLINIFVLDENPKLAAQSMNNKHVVKMVLESIQLLCSPFQPGVAPYKRTHYNHPCAVWTRSSKQNYEWLLDHTKGLLEEYTFRYDKIHSSTEIFNWCVANYNTLNLPDTGQTKFVLAMPDQYKTNSAPESYKNYYIGEKSKLGAWKNREPPIWWPFENCNKSKGNKK